MPWGNGDGRFVYPPLSAADGNPSGPVFDAPVGSMRLDMLRDGIEDYEYMVILSRLVEAHEKLHPEADVSAYRQLLEVPDAITASLTEFTWIPPPLKRIVNLWRVLLSTLKRHNKTYGYANHTRLINLDAIRSAAFEIRTYGSVSP